MAKKTDEEIAAKAVAKANRPWFKKKRFIIPLALVALIVVVSISNSGNKGSSDTTAKSSSSSSASSSSSSSASSAAAVPAEFKSALTQAGSYSKTMHMCKAAIYDQLTSEFGGKFSAPAAQYAVDNVVADWNANALAQAKSYQKTMAMSPAAIQDQLVSQFGGKCTAAEAAYAVAHLND